jgi:hypothetical protein
MDVAGLDGDVQVRRRGAHRHNPGAVSGEGGGAVKRRGLLRHGLFRNRSLLVGPSDVFPTFDFLRCQTLPAALEGGGGGTFLMAGLDLMAEPKRPDETRSARRSAEGTFLVKATAASKFARGRENRSVEWDDNLRCMGGGGLVAHSTVSDIDLGSKRTGKTKARFQQL